MITSQTDIHFSTHVKKESNRDYGSLNEKCLPKAQVFEHLLPSWWRYFGKDMEPLGGGALLEEVHLGGRGRP